MKNTRRGSITVEAAVILPLFIIAILTIGYTIKNIDASCNVMHNLTDEARLMQTYAYDIKTGALYAAEIKTREIESDVTDTVKLSKFDYLYDDAYICVDLKFTIKNRLPIKLQEDFTQKEGVLFRGFIAHDNSGSVYSFDKMQIDDADSIVWVFPVAGEKYHKENCSYIAVEPKQMVLNDSIRNNYSPCRLCKPEEYGNGHLVYVFKTGAVYHSGECTIVDRYVISMSRSQAEAKGYSACKKCGG